MSDVLICGVCGKMGKNVVRCIENDSELKAFAGVDSSQELMNFPVYAGFENVNIIPDVIIDFSHISLLDDILEFAVKNKVPAVLATTGYSKQQIEQIENASKQIPIFFSYNMSLGINLLCGLAKKASSILGDAFDIEIIEKHHNQKLDAPSGTAIMLANAINSQNDDKYFYEYDRHSKRQKRNGNEIGIHSVRGGTIVGEHEVIFAGHDETVTLSHSAYSKEVFAAGAVKAAKFIIGKPAGLYDMNDIINAL